MRAMVLYRQREAMRLSDVPEPKPGPGQVLVCVHVCGVCRKTEEGSHLTQRREGAKGMMRLLSADGADYKDWGKGMWANVAGLFPLTWFLAGGIMARVWGHETE
jgi:hypothetical protein